MNDLIWMRTNLPAFSAQLRAIGADFEKKAVRSAALAAGSVLRKGAVRMSRQVLNKGVARKGRVPGTLAKGIVYRRSRTLSKPGLEVVTVSVKGGKGKADPFYWRFLEGGWIPRGPGSRLRGGNRRRALERKRILAAGGRKVQYPFLAPAFTVNRGAAVDAFVARIARRIADYNANAVR